MKKTIILSGLCILALSTIWPLQAVNHKNISIINMEDNVPTGYEVIVLRGKLNCNTGPDGIVAGANENSVYLHFSQSFGNVNVSVYNPTGLLIYSNMVDTSVQQTVIIPINSMASGTYTVVLDNANGYAEGDFERN